MLEIKNITKAYETAGFKQKALDNVSLNFRKSEFASILGPSGSGKTTFLNIIGGLDHYDEGDLVINEVSTKKYKDKDWYSYRNHRIGFIFQSYNLISHQSILNNVKLALVLSGISNILIPIINLILHHYAGNIPLNAYLGFKSAFILILLSIILTLIGGIIPAIAASKKDSVEALRTE